MNNLDILVNIPDPNIDGEEKANALKSAFAPYNKIAKKLRKDELENIIIYLMDYVDFEEVKRNPAKWQNHSLPQYRWHDLRKNPDDLPEPEKEVEIAYYNDYSEKYYTARAFYEDGNVHSEDSIMDGGEDGWECWCEYCEETDDYIIPEGWLE